MTSVFIFEDYCDNDYDPLKNHVHQIDINKELADLEEDGWSIKSVQHQILCNYKKNYETFDKNVYTVVVERAVYE